MFTGNVGLSPHCETLQTTTQYLHLFTRMLLQGCFLPFRNQIICRKILFWTGKHVCFTRLTNERSDFQTRRVSTSGRELLTNAVNLSSIFHSRVLVYLCKPLPLGPFLCLFPSAWSCDMQSCGTRVQFCYSSLILHLYFYVTLRYSAAVCRGWINATSDLSKTAGAVVAGLGRTSLYFS